MILGTDGVEEDHGGQSKVQEEDISDMGMQADGQWEVVLSF
jgi:hypothetical protein